MALVNTVHRMDWDRQLRRLQELQMTSLEEAQYEGEETIREKAGPP